MQLLARWIDDGGYRQPKPTVFSFGELPDEAQRMLDGYLAAVDASSAVARPGAPHRRARFSARPSRVDASMLSGVPAIGRLAGCPQRTDRRPLGEVGDQRPVEAIGSFSC